MSFLTDEEFENRIEAIINSILFDECPDDFEAQELCEPPYKEGDFDPADREGW